MMLKRWFISLAFLLFPLAAFAQTPRLPYADNGACPFECCTYRTWSANKATAIRSKRDGSGTVAFNVKKGEKVKALTGVVITTQYGVVKVLRAATVDGVRVKAGETLYMLTYQGEGVYTTWYKGRLLSAGELENNQSFKVISHPKAVWWIQIRNKRGKTGWTNLPDNFDNKDRCG